MSLNTVIRQARSEVSQKRCAEKLKDLKGDGLSGAPACARSLCSGSKWVVSDDPRIMRQT